MGPVPEGALPLLPADTTRISKPRSHLFREAIALDPGLAIARAYLGNIMLQGAQYGWIKSTRELWARRDGAG